jgi:hypothetical protein
MILESLVITCRMNPLAISIILSEEFLRVRILLEKHYRLQWYIALSEILEPKEKEDYMMCMSDDILLMLVEYLD